MTEQLRKRLRSLPSVDRVAEVLRDAGPSSMVTAIARRAIDSARDRIRAGGAEPTFEEIVEDARSMLASRDRALLQRVINATGVLIHTNLGRVPLGREQLDAVTEIAGAYSNLEYDIEAGARGSRYSHAAGLITAVTGAEAALVVNNNAAAVLLSLAALCKDQEVIVSRGELIEIGGEFRIPDVMAASGARIVEVGTTNRTHIADYERAITPDTAAILKVHPSNYKVVGFTAEVAARDVARLARGRGVCFIHDLGSGLLSKTDLAWTASEPFVTSALEDGADLVTFSGDKLLGGPQAGILAGRSDLIEVISKHPLVRALRVDKMTLAALEATLRLHMEGRSVELPLWRMATASLDELEIRARAVAEAVAEANPDVKCEAIAMASLAGGGSLPGTEVSSWGVAVDHPEKSAAELHRRLLAASPPIVARVEAERLVLDLRTVDPADDDVVQRSLLNSV